MTDRTEKVFPVSGGSRKPHVGQSPGSVASQNTSLSQEAMLALAMKDNAVLRRRCDELNKVIADREVDLARDRQALHRSLDVCAYLKLERDTLVGALADREADLAHDRALLHKSLDSQADLLSSRDTLSGALADREAVSARESSMLQALLAAQRKDLEYVVVKMLRPAVLIKRLRSARYGRLPFIRKAGRRNAK